MSRTCGLLTAITANSAKELIKLNTLLTKLTRSHQYSDAFQLFHRIYSSHHLKPDHYTLSAAITSCASTGDGLRGSQLHGYALRSGLNAFPHVSNTLLSLYSKSQDLNSVKWVFDEIENPDVYSWTTLLSACTKLGDISYACEVFDKMPHRSIAIWNAMITGCADFGCNDVALKLFTKMHSLDVRLDNYSLASVLSLCSMELLIFGLQIHSLVVKTGLLAQASVLNSLLTVYFSFKMVDAAFAVFEEVGPFEPDQITYNAMISGLVSMERNRDAFLMLKSMQNAGLLPTELSFVSIMGSCCCSEEATQVHAQCMKVGLEDCTSVSNAAITMYANCGDLDSARVVFERLSEKDVVSWNAMITSYAQLGFGREAVLVYVQMQRERVKPDEFTIGSLLVSSECLAVVEVIYGAVMKNALVLKVEVSNALLSAFSKHNHIDKADLIFSHMTSRNLISFNTLISGYLMNGFPIQGLNRFAQLIRTGIVPNTFTLSIALNTCASISAIQYGKEVHASILKREFSSDTSLNNALITLYAKCGSLDLSANVFKKTTKRDTITWNSMISAYKNHGEGILAVQCFETMQDYEARPDEATFTAVLSACSHSGLVTDGCRIFNSMMSCFGVEPEADHFSCIVDLLGRAGFLDETETLISSRHIEVDSSVWWTLFSSCAAHGNLRLGRIVAGILMETEQHDDPAIYVLLSNVYANAGEWKESANVRELMKRCRILKQPGSSWIGS